MSTMPDRWHDAYHSDAIDPECIHCQERMIQEICTAGRKSVINVHVDYPQVAHLSTWVHYIDNPPHDTIEEQEGEGAS